MLVWSNGFLCRQTYLSVHRRRVKLIKQLRESVRGEIGIRGDTIPQSVLQILRGDAIRIVRRGLESDGKVVEDGIEQILRVSMYVPLSHWYLEEREDDHEISWILFSFPIRDEASHELMIVIMELAHSISVLSHQQVDELNDRISLSLQLELPQRVSVVEKGSQHLLCRRRVPFAQSFESNECSRGGANAFGVTFQTAENEVAEQPFFLHGEYLQGQGGDNISKVRHQIGPNAAIVLVVDVRFEACDQIDEL